MFLKISCVPERTLIMLQNGLFCPVMANMQIKRDQTKIIITYINSLVSHEEK